MENSKFNLILASSSPRRKELLGHLAVPFQILTENVPEESTQQDPVEFCRDIALIKGQAVASKLDRQKSWYVVSADTIVCLDERIFGKPRDRDEARNFLSLLSGRTHSVYTAVAMRLIHQGKEVVTSFVDESRVTFDHISPPLMELYLDTRDSLDKAGAYGIQGPSLTFISKVDGSYSNVVGFPLSRFVQESETFLQKNLTFGDSWLKLF